MAEPTVYDVRDPKRNPWLTSPPAFRDAYRTWLHNHGINPNDTYRTEHHLIDAPLVRAFQHERDTDGHHRIDPITRDIIKRKPFDVLTKTPPPNPEDYA